MSGTVLDRNLEGDSVEYNCMDTDVIKLVLFFFHDSMYLCVIVVRDLEIVISILITEITIVQN